MDREKNSADTLQMGGIGETESIYITEMDTVDSISFRGVEWSVLWPQHAQNRTYDRHSIPAVARQCLRFLLKILDPFSDQFWSEFGNEVVLRAYPLKSCFMLKVDEGTKTLCVTTFGGIGNFAPRFGDTVVTLADNGTVSCQQWQNRESPGPQIPKKYLGRCEYLAR